MKKFYKKIIHRYFSRITQGSITLTYSDGTQQIYGNDQEPKTVVEIKNERFIRRLALYGDIGFGESYMDGDFECSDITALITIGLLNSKELGIKSDDSKATGWKALFGYPNKIKHLMRKNSKTQSRKNISQHYDLSNAFFALMLDDTMMYSSAIFAHPKEPLQKAQERKIRHLADKLRLKKGDRVLEIGSGWGAMALHLAKERGCKVTTLTLSKEQQALCQARFSEHQVEKQIDVLLKDYRDMEGSFDAIIAVEMFEAVGKEYFDIFFKKCQALLKPSGVLAMQIITMPDQRYPSYANGTDFIQKYIFPGGHLPSVAKLLETTATHTRFNLLHLEEFSEDYAKTLKIWHDNFAQKLNEVRILGFDEYFIRMWRFYLSYCEAGFATRNINLVQVAFSRDQNIHLNKGLFHEN